MNEAELEIRLSQITYPTIHYCRESVLSCFMDSSNYVWEDGRLVHRHPGDKESKKAKAIRESILDGTAPTLDEALTERFKTDAERQAKENEGEDPILRDLFSFEKCFDNRMQRAREEHVHPKTYRLVETCCYGPIYSIPDNVKPEWLAICIEYLNHVLASKTDFDERSILTPSDQVHFFGKSGQLTTEEKDARAQLSEELGKILAETDSKSWPPTDEQKAKERADWDKFYSPAARARRANEENTQSKEVAAKILEDLQKRGIML